MKKVLFIFLFCFLVTTGKAQFLDSMNLMFRSHSSIDARLESRVSFYKNELINITGVRLGIAYKRKLRIGGGFSWVKSDYTSEFYEYNSDLSKIDTVSKYMKLGYLCYYIDFVFHRTKRWQLSVPIQAGTGLSWFQKEKAYRFHNHDPKYFLFLYEPGITVQFKVFRWVGLGADVAYRFTLKNQKKIGEKLNSPTYSIKVLFWPDQLFYQVLPNHKLSKRYGPAEW